MKEYLLDQMLNGEEAVCMNLVRQGKKVIRLPRNLHGASDTKVIAYAKSKNYRLVTKDKGCARQAKQYQVHAILIQD